VYKLLAKGNANS